MTYSDLLKGGLSDNGKGIKWLQSAIDFLNSKHEYDYMNDCNLSIAINNVCNKLKFRYSFDKNGIWSYYK